MEQLILPLPPPTCGRRPFSGDALVDQTMDDSPPARFAIIRQGGGIGIDPLGYRQECDWLSFGLDVGILLYYYVNQYKYIDMSPDSSHHHLHSSPNFGGGKFAGGQSRLKKLK